MRFVLAVVLLAGLAAGFPDVAKADELGFVPPAPGSYVLQHILRAPEGHVLDTSSQPRRLSRFTTGKITLLSLIYTTSFFQPQMVLNDMTTLLLEEVRGEGLPP